MILVGLDPSFSGAGVSVLDTEERKIRISDARDKIGRKTFENVFEASLRIHQKIRDFFDLIEVNPDILMSEKPYAGGQFSSGLHTLDGTLFLDFIYRYKSLKRVYLMTARFLTHVHKQNGIKKYSKSDSTKLVRSGLLPVFEEYGYDIEYGIRGSLKGGLNNNSAESFIFLARLFLMVNEKDKFDCREGLMDDLYNVAKGLFTEKEDLLFDRSEIID